MELPDLSCLVGDPAELSGRTSLNLATIMIVVKDGKAVKVIEPGRGYRRGLRLPAFGDVAGIPLSSAEHISRLTIRDIATNDSYAMPSLDLQIALRLNDGDGYGALLRYVRDNGADFAGSLEPRVWNAVDEFVRSELGCLTHPEVFGKNLARLLPVNQPLLGGLFVITQVIAGEAAYDPLFLQLRTSEAETLAKINAIKQETVVTVNAQQATLETMTGEHLIEQVRLRHELSQAQQTALTLGVPVAAIHSPDIFNAQLGAQLELTKALIENYRAAGSQAVRDALQTVGQSFSGPAAAPPLSFLDAAAGCATPPLSRDTRLEAVWRDRGLDDTVMGAGVAQRGGSAAVLLVVNDPARVAAMRDRIRHQLADVLGADVRLDVARHDPELGRLVGEYLAAAIDGFAEVAERCGVTVDGRRLTVSLPCPTGQWQRAKRAVSDPNAMILEPLRRLLPYDDVDVVPAGSS